jgi:hypothetical protein
MENMREMRGWTGGSCKVRALNASKKYLRLTTVGTMINDQRIPSAGLGITIELSVANYEFSEC